MCPKAPTQDRAVAPRSLLRAKLTLAVSELALATVRTPTFCAVHVAHLRLVLVTCCCRWHGGCSPTQWRVSPNFYFENENSLVKKLPKSFEKIKKFFLSVIREGVKGMVRRWITWLSGYSLA